MNKLLAITVLVTLLALSAESFRVLRQAAEGEQGTLTMLTSTVKSYYDSARDTASQYVETIKGLKLEEKAKNFYTETTTVMGTYLGIMQDQIYHILQNQN